MTRSAADRRECCLLGNFLTSIKEIFLRITSTYPSYCRILISVSTATKDETVARYELHSSSTPPASFLLMLMS